MLALMRVQCPLQVFRLRNWLHPQPFKTIKFVKHLHLCNEIIHTQFKWKWCWHSCSLPLVYANKKFSQVPKQPIKKQEKRRSFHFSCFGQELNTEPISNETTALIPSELANTNFCSQLHLYVNSNVRQAELIC